MAKNRNISSLREMHGVQAFTHTPAAGEYTGSIKLLDLKAVLENLHAQGQEAMISKAQTTIILYGSDCPIDMIVAALLSDQAIASTATGQNNAYGIVDADLNVMTAGDFELQTLGNLSAKELYANRYQGVKNFDITQVVRKAAQLIARSAVLSTNPEIALVGHSINSASNKAVNGVLFYRISYAAKQRPLRMLA